MTLVLETHLYITLKTLETSNKNEPSEMNRRQATSESKMYETKLHTHVCHFEADAKPQKKSWANQKSKEFVA